MSMSSTPVRSVSGAHTPIAYVGTSEYAELPVSRELGVTARFVGSVQRSVTPGCLSGDLRFSFLLDALQKGFALGGQTVSIEKVQVIEHKNAHKTVRASIPGRNLQDARRTGEGFRGKVTIASINDAAARGRPQAEADLSFVVTAQVLGKRLQFEMREVVRVPLRR